MNNLECRFYPLTEIRELTKKERARDIKNLLSQWGYRYEWKDRKGVHILSKPSSPEERFASLARQRLSLDAQIEMEPFAWFLTLLLEDDEFSSMPWRTRSEVLFNVSGFEVSERTLRSWAKYLFRGDYLTKDREYRTVWFSQASDVQNYQEMVENPEEDEAYCAYNKERSALIAKSLSEGLPHSTAYKNAICFLWQKYHRIYYYCYQIATNAINQNDLFELVRLAHEWIDSKNQTSSEDNNIRS